ncbi:MAG: hypothetical protein IT236_15840 [Bacteroidia bacterium]|nr:hypothetical protein [Bacteroidia bacterium]
MNTYYKPSGAMAPISIIYFLILCFLIVPLLALGYAYATWYIPFIYINIIIAAALGAFTGVIADKLVIKKGMVRNPILALVFGMIAGLFACYFQWAVWVSLVINAGDHVGFDSLGFTVSNIKIVQVFQLSFHPEMLYRLASAINESGTWSIKGGQVSGIPLTIIWIIEALIITGISLALAYVPSKKPFSENNNRWFDEFELGKLFTLIENKEQFVKDLEAGKEEALQTLPFCENETSAHSRITLYGDESDYYVSIANKLPKTNKDGKIEFSEEDVVTNLSISYKLGSELLQKGK